MIPNPTRSNGSSVAAACILSGGLIAAAIINSHRPVIVSRDSVSASLAIPSGAKTPPVAQDAVAQQFRDQLLESPKLHGLRANNALYTLNRVDVTNICYSSKDDVFTVSYDLSWLPSGKGLRNSGVDQFSGDGYGHYFSDVVVLGSDTDAAMIVHVTLR